MADLVSHVITSVFDDGVGNFEGKDRISPRECDVKTRQLPTWADLSPCANLENPTSGGMPSQNPFMVDLRPASRIKIYQGDICSLDAQALCFEVASVFPTENSNPPPRNESHWGQKYNDPRAYLNNGGNSGSSNGTGTSTGSRSLPSPESRDADCSVLRIGGCKNIIKEYHQAMSLNSGNQLISTLTEEGLDHYSLHFGDPSSLAEGVYGTAYDGTRYPCVGQTIVVAPERGETSLSHPSRLLRGGEVVVLKGSHGNLACEKLVLFSGPRYTDRYKKAARHTWHVCVREILKVCDENRIKSVAIPIYFTARKGYPMKESLHVLMRSLRRWLDLLPRVIEEVILVSPFHDYCELASDLAKLYFPRYSGEGIDVMQAELNLWIRSEGVGMVEEDEKARVEAGEPEHPESQEEPTETTDIEDFFNVLDNPNGSNPHEPMNKQTRNPDGSKGPIFVQISGGKQVKLSTKQRRLLTEAFFGDPRTGDSIESTDDRKMHDNLRRMIGYSSNFADSPIKGQAGKAQLADPSNPFGTLDNRSKDLNNAGKLPGAILGAAEDTGDGSELSRYVQDWDDVSTRRLSLSMWEAETLLESSRIYFRRLRTATESQNKYNIGRYGFMQSNVNTGTKPGAPFPGELGSEAPHIWLFSDKIPLEFGEEELLQYITLSVEPMRELATPVRGNQKELAQREATQCYFIYNHKTGAYLPRSRLFFAELLRTVEHIFPGMHFVLLHPTMPLKALVAFWYATGSIPLEMWERIHYIETTSELRAMRIYDIPEHVKEYDALFNSANYYLS